MSSLIDKDLGDLDVAYALHRVKRLHFLKWLRALEDAIAALRMPPSVDQRRIGVLGIPLGGYLAVGLGLSDTRWRVVIELSGGIPPGWEDHVFAAMPPTWYFMAQWTV